MICSYQNALIIIIFWGFINCGYSINDYPDYEDLLLKEISSNPTSTKHEVTSATPYTDYETNLNISYTYIKNVLNISLIASGNKLPYDSYDVLLKCDLYNTFLKGIKVTAIQPKTIVTFENVVKPYQNHTIRIFPFIKNRKYEKNFTEKVFLGGYKLDSIDCNSWKPKFGVRTDSKNMNIKVLIGVKEEYKSCFPMFEVFLTKIIHEKCSDITIDEEKVNSDVMMSVDFENISAGNYCVKYHGIHENCPKQRCIPYFSLVELKAMENQDVIIALPSIKVSSYIDYIIPLSICIVISIIVVMIIFLIWKGVLHYKLILDLLKLFKKSQKEKHYYEEKEGICNAVKATTPTKELIVPILYAQDCSNQNKVTIALYNFFNECFHVKPIIDVNSTEDICKGDIAWIENLVKYRCAKWTDSGKENENKKLIILETECALKLYQAWEKHQNLYYKKYSSLNEFFTYGLNYLFSNVQQYKSDYCHLFVVRFSYSPSEKMDIVQKRRFTLPDCLVDLYNCLHDIQTDFIGQQRENLLQEWEEKISYRELKQAIKEMEEYVKTNPNYVDNLFLTNVDDLKDIYIV